MYVAPGLPVSGEQLQSQLQWIVEQKTPSSSHPISYLTAADRDEWAVAREVGCCLKGEKKKRKGSIKEKMKEGQNEKREGGREGM